MNAFVRGLFALGLLSAAGLLGACSPGEQVGSQTNWFRSCTDDEACGDLECVCGVCSSRCEKTADCSGPAGVACIPANDPGTLALCGGAGEAEALCLTRCEDAECPSGTSCYQGVCVPPTLVSFDLTSLHQTLVGFGAGLGYTEDELAQHPQKEALLDALFQDSGLDVVRLRNRFEVGNVAGIDVTSELLTAAGSRVDRPLLLLMGEGSPPPNLKANGSRNCAGDADVCTLVQLDGGGFDYAGLATHWRASLDAYSAVGITPDYLSLQNNPNWVPPSSGALEACRFLPEEGSTTVVIDGVQQTVTYPGYQEALLALVPAIESLDAVPLLLGPETTGVSAFPDYAPSLSSGLLGASACHLYGTEAAAPDLEAFAAMKTLADESGLPLFQTEMSAEGLDTAVLIHHAVTEAGAAMYLQNDFVGSASSLEGNVRALIQLSDDGFALQGPYFAIAHFAQKTAPGWRRATTVTNRDTLLASAWLSPAGDALTIVLVNPGTEDIRLALDLDDVRGQFLQSEVTRTVFDGADALAKLGELANDNTVRLLAGSVVTVAFSN